MKTFRLTVNLSVVEVPEPLEEPTSQIESPDPVARDKDELSATGIFRAMKTELTGIFPSTTTAFIPDSQIRTHAEYDVAANSLEDVVGIVKRFEDLGESIGMRTKTPLPPIVGTRY